MYSTTSISPPYSFVATMLCRLFSKPDNTKFSLELLPLIEADVNTTIMNWAQILFDNLAKAITKYRRNRSPSSRVYTPFFMSAYVMDTIYFGSKFLVLGWKWTMQDPLLIHVYHKSPWDSKFHPCFYNICQGVMLHIHQQVYNRTTARFSKEATVDILPIAIWFGEDTFTYIRVFGSIVSLHFLPYYAPDKLMAKEIAYQNVREGGLSKGLKE